LTICLFHWIFNFRNIIMPKLSPALKALINSPHARPGTIPAPAQIGAVYSSIAEEAEPRNVGLKAWFGAAVSLFLLDFVGYC
jgi:hypothetical protein